MTFIPKDLIGLKSALTQEMAWCQVGCKPLYGLITQLIIVWVHHKATKS